MKPISPQLLAHYAEPVQTTSICWKAELTDGTIVGATNSQTDIVFDGVTYFSTVGFTHTDVESGSQLAADNLEITGFLASPAITEEDLHTGKWDNAKIDIFEVNRADLSMGARLLRCGTLGAVVGSRGAFNAEFRGLMQALSTNIVRVTTQTCTADLGDARCKVDLAPFTVTGTLTEVSSNGVFTDSSRTEESDWFTNGKLTMTSGLNVGKSMEVRSSTSAGLITLYLPFYLPIEVGETYSMYAGCRKRLIDDCQGKFNNVVNFRGFPFVPGHKIYKAGSR
jgi:uncharacterized phage protein (TIGR02218 family)